MKWKWFLGALALLVVTNLLVGQPRPGLAGEPPAVNGTTAPQQVQPGPQVLWAEHHDLSAPLVEMARQAAVEGEMVGEAPERRFISRQAAQGILKEPEVIDAALQAPRQPQEAGSMPAPLFNFDGISNRNGVLPPDTNGDVGPGHYVQWVNLSLAIWELHRSTNEATLVLSPQNGNVIWWDFGGPCKTSNDGDPIVLYDHLADRWLVSQFALPNDLAGPFYECIAISQTSDPTGDWYRYAFRVSDTKMNDYPKLGVWPDGYYMSVNQFTQSGNWGGAGVFAFERDMMLQGQEARMVYFDLYGIDPNFGGMLPSDLDGPPPLAGTPNYFAEVDDGDYVPPQDALRIWEFHVDWNKPGQSTFGLDGQPNFLLPVAEFTPLCLDTSACIRQPVTSARLDALGDRLMHRLQFRQYGDYATLATNHTVNVGGERAGVRWYELHNPGEGWEIYQQGTYAGDVANNESRWMGSLALDNRGNLALGYSISSSEIFPGIRYTGRLASDPLGALPQGEATLMDGSGSQTHSKSRWGDYSMMSVDPVDDCTFWYTQQYYPFTSSAAWYTRIGSFVFPGCLADSRGAIQGHIIDVDSGEPLANVQVQAGEYTTLTDAAGDYRFYDLPVGVYKLSAAQYEYYPQTVNGIQVNVTPLVLQDFALQKAARRTAQGVVTDGSGQGWPLYARLKINASGFAQTIFTDPLTGAYSIELSEAYTHSLHVEAVGGGYLAQDAGLEPSQPDWNKDFALLVDAAACTAPGYVNSGGCNPQAGGLLMGNIFDENTNAVIDGALVRSQALPTETALSAPTPDDLALNDGFYALFSSLVGAQVFSAEQAGYGVITQSVAVSLGAVTRADFTLPAGLLALDPPQVMVYAEFGEVLTEVVHLSNSGNLGAGFDLSEVTAPLQPLAADGPFAPAARHTSPKRLSDLNASAVYIYQPPDVPQLAGGTVLDSWASGLTHPWGIGYDAQQDVLWVGDVAAGGGDDRLHAFSPHGAPTGLSIERATQAVFAAGMAYQPFSGKFWQLDVAGDNCLVEIDPQIGVMSGEKICPEFAHSGRGLAFNPLERSFYAASWTDGILYHFDAGGRILDSTALGLNISGLAFNPASGHLFALTNADQGFDVYVLDTAQAYAILGGFDIPGLGDFQQAGLTLDCSGRLWTVDQASGLVYQVDSGENGPCAWTDIPWLTVQPLSGTVAAQDVLSLTLRLDANGLQPGANQGHVVVNNSTPYGETSLPVTLFLKAYAIGLSPAAQAWNAMPGEQLRYYVQVTNAGNYTDTFTLQTSGSIWPVTVAGEIGPLAPDESIVLEVLVQVPQSAPLGQSDTLQIQIISQSNPDVTQTIVLQTNVLYHLFSPLVRKNGP